MSGAALAIEVVSREELVELAKLEADYAAATKAVSDVERSLKAARLGLAEKGPRRSRERPAFDGSRAHGKLDGGTRSAWIVEVQSKHSPLPLPENLLRTLPGLAANLH